MKHIHTITQRPTRAQDPTIGQILTLIANLLNVIGSALLAKETGGASS